MGKKRSRPVAATEEQPPPPANIQSTNEIDQIFAKRKNPKTPSNPTEPSHPLENDAQLDEKKAKKKKKNKKEGNEWQEPKPRRKTNDGYTVYSAEELGFNKRDAGGTPLCPFDCDCCF